MVCAIRGNGKINTGRRYYGLQEILSLPAFLVTLLKEGWTKDSIITESMIEVAFAAAADFSGRNCLREGSFGMGLSIEM